METRDQQGRLSQLGCYWRAANYLGAAQLYLRDNVLLREPLRPKHIKPRLLGHWGTQPGLNLIYAHLNRLISDVDADVSLVVGPGHGAPAILADLFLEGSLAEYYPELSRDGKGLAQLVRQFSWPGGFPSHLGPMVPGTLHEGGELGYCLAHAFGVAFDRPEAIVACVVGDGEAETGPLAASWHAPKFLDPASCGAVLPILHLNGYKLSAPSIFGRMSGLELHQFFCGVGYEVRIVAPASPDAAHVQLWKALDWAYAQIRAIQSDRRRWREDGSPQRRWTPAWPLIILRTLKGWTGPELVDGVQIEGTFHSHQLPISDPATNPEHLRLLEAWLRSYEPEKLFDADGCPLEDVVGVCPRGDRRLGMKAEANHPAVRALQLPAYTAHALTFQEPGSVQAEATTTLGGYLADVFRLNAGQRNFRLFSPDETSSNHLQDVFVVTDRAWQLPTVPSDEHLTADGRVMEVLSEHLCEGWLEGYVLSGRHGIFACYEGFSGIVASMVTQYAKWIKVAREIPWRGQVSSLNLLLASHAWRQDHNGYSHQGPGFIDTLLTKKSSIVRVYLPPDANCLLATMEHCLAARSEINLIIAGKNAAPQWLSATDARDHCERKASAWQWASDAGTPEIVMACAGDVPTYETLAAVSLLREHTPQLKLRTVNLTDLLALELTDEHPHGLPPERFAELFGDDTPVIFAFHGYPHVIHELIHHRPNAQRFHVRGYIEEGTTTTPFDMTVLNRMSRFHLAAEAIRRSGRDDAQARAALNLFDERLAAHYVYIREHGIDMPEIRDWRWRTTAPAAARM